LQAILFLTIKVQALDITPFIRDLILSSECVILRGFGGFETSYRNASVDKSKNLITPPGKKITFRPDWTKDNGILENYIASSLNITPEKASKYISIFVYDLLTRIENEGSALLEGIGRFKKNKSRVLEFYELEDVTYLADSFGLDTLDIEAAPSSKENSSVPEIKPILPQRRKMTGLYVVIGLLILSILITSIIYFSGKEGMSIFNFSKKTVKVPNKSDMIVFGKKNDVLQDSVKQAIEQTLKKSTVPKKALSPDIPAEHTKLNVTEVPTDHLYFLVAGSFKSLKNAELLKKKLENKGFKSEILTNQGNYVKVIIGKFDDKNEAIAELKRIRIQINQSVWLMEK
jgi:nucleoid DNA-binding protein